MVSAEESARNYQVMVAPMYHLKPTFPMPAAGMYPGLAPVLVEEFGIDQIIPAGGGMLGHPMGYTAGARAWRQAIDAALAEIPLTEAAKTKPELKAAIEQWGIRVRPKTAWGYSGKEFHPAFASKNVD
jgi:2,3-diketo-5-methylthiopentyl-1-phosphate enolase